eukprot:10550145-Alexandrium_andersonii.AAC.1
MCIRDSFLPLERNTYLALSRQPLVVRTSEHAEQPEQSLEELRNPTLHIPPEEELQKFKLASDQFDNPRGPTVHCLRHRWIRLQRLRLRELQGPYASGFSTVVQEGGDDSQIQANFI